MLRSFAFLLTDWVSGCVSFNNFEVEARIWFLHEINLSYWKGHSRTWLWQRDECLGCGHQRLLFSHIYSKSFIIHWINNCNVIVNSFKGKHFIETGPELFLSVKTLFPMATITQIIDLKVFWKAFLLNVFIIKGYWLLNYKMILDGKVHLWMPSRNFIVGISMFISDLFYCRVVKCFPSER